MFIAADAPQEETNGTDEGPRKGDIIIITGKPENCENAKQALLVG